MSDGPIDAVEKAQALLERGPITAVAAFFIIAFFFSLWLLLREKDSHRRHLYELSLRVELLLQKVMATLEEERKPKRRRTGDTGSFTPIPPQDKP